MILVGKGDKVRVHYVGKLDDGTVFDSSLERDPLEFVVGEGQLIAPFEEAMIGMTVDQTRNINVAAEDAYGVHQEDLVHEVPREHFPGDFSPEEGQMLELNFEGGQTLLVRIEKIGEEVVILDANHPLAGQNLNFEITLVEIV